MNTFESFLFILLTLIYKTPLVIGGGASIVPPRYPHEGVHDMRKRLNITYNYEPKNMHPEFCRGLTEEECERHDRRLQESTGNPSTGSVTAIVLLVRFADHRNAKIPGSSLPSREYIDQMMNGKRGQGPNTVGSIADYYKYNSLMKYDVKFWVSDWIDLPNPQSYYGAGNYGIGCDKDDLIGFALQHVYDNDLSWDPAVYDTARRVPCASFDPVCNTGQDAIFDSILLIHSGEDASYGTAFPFAGDTCSDGDPLNRIWSHGCSNNNGKFVLQDLLPYRIGGFGVASAFDDCAGTWTKMGIPAHEIMHGFGLIDLYNVGGNNFPGGTADFDLMSYPCGRNDDCTIPGHLGPYSKLKLGWLDPIPIVTNGFYALQPSELSGQVYIITEGFPDGEYLLIENRQPLKWDQDWDCGGIVVYHVDERVTNQSNNNRLRVAVEQRDGNFDLEAGRRADCGDFWISPYVISPGQRPSTRSYTNGETGIVITFLTKPGFIMTIRVEGFNGGFLAPGFTPPRFETVPQRPEEGPLQPILINTTNSSGSVGGLRISSADTETNTGNNMSWILSMLGGVAVLMGFAAFMLL